MFNRIQRRAFYRNVINVQVITNSILVINLVINIKQVQFCPKVAQNLNILHSTLTAIYLFGNIKVKIKIERERQRDKNENAKKQSGYQYYQADKHVLQLKKSILENH